MPNLREFAATHDLIFFVSGKKSSNGKMLFEECLKVNANSHLIDNEKEIDPSLLRNVESIGVCGATSTPKWLMEKIHDHIQLLIKIKKKDRRDNLNIFNGFDHEKKSYETLHQSFCCNILPRQL